MARKLWIGSIALTHYPALGRMLQWGDEVDVPDEILAKDPDSFSDLPEKPKAGKGQAESPQKEQ